MRDFEIGDPTSWPKRWRRLFLLTAPISYPLYLATMTALVIIGVIVIAVLAPVIHFERIWNGRTND
jgi:hypothetical protein